MANTKKMTYASAIENAIAALNTVEGVNPEVLEKLAALKVSLDKKNAAPRALTAQQKKNETLKNEIAEFLEDNADRGFTVTEVMKAIPSFEGDSNQHVSALLRQLADAEKDGRAEKYSEKRRTYFRFRKKDVD
jgi:hypothetical protein